MKAYVINLEKRTDRREHIEQELSKMPYIDFEIVNAVDGRVMTLEEKSKIFNIEKFEKRYSKKADNGAVGCELSHQKCFKKIINSSENYALIFEDDMIVKTDLKQILEDTKLLYESNNPVIILFSGWFWWNTKHKFNKTCIVSIHDALLSQGYLITKSAAELLLEERPFITSDDWRYIISRGVNVYGIIPHPLEQIWTDSSDIGYEKSNIIKLTLKYRLRLYGRELIRKLYKFCGHFESCLWLDNFTGDVV